MSEFENNEFEPENNNSNIKEEEKSAKKIIEDYLNQIKTRLPPTEAEEIISEIRSHLIEKASQQNGTLTTKSAWDAVVSMGNPELLAKEFIKESKTTEPGQPVKGFIASLKLEYRNWFWRIFTILITMDIITLAILSTLMVAMIVPILNFISAIIGMQFLIFIGAGIVYFILLYFSYPEGTPVEVVFQKIGDNFSNLFQNKEQKEKRVLRAQRKVKHRINKLNKLTDRKMLIGETIGNFILGIVLLALSLAFVSLEPAYPIVDLEFLQLLGVIAMTRSALSGMRAIVDGDNLLLARVLASINVLYGIVGIYFIVQFFYGPISLPVPVYNLNGVPGFTLFYWKLYLMPFIWIATIIIAIIAVSMIYQIVEINMYVKETKTTETPTPMEINKTYGKENQNGNIIRE